MQRITSLWKFSKRGKIIIIGWSLLVLCIFCSVVTTIFSPASSNVEPTVDVGAIQTHSFETAWAQSIPSETLAPTNTPLPTDTPLPTATSTPLPQPIILTGAGDSIVDIQKWKGPALLHAKHTGFSNFVVLNYPANSTDPIDLLVNTIGSYEGTLPLDFFDSEHTVRFEIKADGAWELQIQPFETLRRIQLPATIQGRGDDVFGVVGSPDLIKADASQSTSNFAVHSFGSNGCDLIFNEIAPYTGTAMLDPSVFLLVVTAEGPWSLEITTK